MARDLYGAGAYGGTVAEIQRALLAANFDPKGTDGVYGGNTTAAVQAFQAAKALPATGQVDDVTWQALMQRPIPGTDVRSLELTAAFEGHGYTLAQGNWDGAWLTWGVIGFTLQHGEVQKIILNIQASDPPLIAQAFGDKAADLIGIMQASGQDQEQWANSVSAGSSLVEPWRTGFAALGQFPEVQAEQRRQAHDDYFVPAVNTARKLGLKSELGLALCFDIHVQNGGICSAAQSTIDSAGAPNTERDLRVTVANAVADSAMQAFSADVRQRKLSIANGEGDVHGEHFVLDNWGLSEAPTPELA